MGDTAILYRWRCIYVLTVDTGHGVPAALLTCRVPQLHLLMPLPITYRRFQSCTELQLLLRRNCINGSERGELIRPLDVHKLLIIYKTCLSHHYLLRIINCPWAGCAITGMQADCLVRGILPGGRDILEATGK